MKSFVLLSAAILVVFLVFVPYAGAAQGIVPCGQGKVPCTFNDLIKLAKNIIDFLLKVVAVPLATISIAWAGVLYTTAQGDEAKIGKAHEIFYYTVIGMIVAFGAWLIVNTIVSALGSGSLSNPLGR